MSWRDYYQQRLTSAEEAVRVVKSGDRVVLGHACGEPQTLVEALVNRAAELVNVEISHEVPMGKALYCQPQYEGHFHMNSLFAGSVVRQAIKEGRADYTAIYLHEVPGFMRSGFFPIDVALVTVSPPDEQGMVSLGVSVDYTWQAVRSATKAVAEVNPNMPRTGPNSLLPVSAFDSFVSADTPLIPLQPPEIGSIEQAIGENVASLIMDGDCLQLGIGAVPDAILKFLADKKDLGIHSEMISDGVMELVKQGVVTCARKNYNPGKIVISFAMGSPDFYRWLDNNPMIDAMACDVTNDPNNVSRNDNMVAVNSALSVDILGQVAADTLSGIQFSGVGGQVDFVRGANKSRNGRAIIALPSTAAGGKTSRICAALGPAQAVTTSRYDVNYVITEYGIARLKGLTDRQRADAIIGIAAPEFREDLKMQRRALYGC